MFGGPRIEPPEFTLVAFYLQTQRLSSCQFLQCHGPKSFPSIPGTEAEAGSQVLRSFPFDVKNVTQQRLFEYGHDAPALNH